MKFYERRSVQVSFAFVLGGIITALFLNQTTLKKTEVELRTAQEAVVSTKAEASKLKEELNNERKKKVTKVKYRTVYPSGKIVESEFYEAVSEQVERIRREERAVADERVAAAKAEVVEKKTELVKIKNPKTVSFTAGPILTNPGSYGFNVSAKLWGPVVIGVTATTKGTVIPMVGIIF